MAQLTKKERQEVLNELTKSYGELKGNMVEDMGVREKIHSLTMKLEGTQPTSSYVSCIDCGS